MLTDMQEALLADTKMKSQKTKKKKKSDKTLS